MEFELIDFIKNKVNKDGSVVIGIGDDAAVTEIPANHQLVISTDTLVDRVHFDHHLSPKDIGHKCLAVNLSDLAAMGATPKWFTLNLTLPRIDQNWIEEFTQGLLDLANIHNVNLVGGDTTQGSLSITITAFGIVKSHQYLQRNTARKGDLIAISGQLGSAAHALKNPNSILSQYLKRPEARLDISHQIKTFASSCIDISDGLISDLGHICKASNSAAQINIDQIPVAEEVKQSSQWQHSVLSGGDDYQLCFTFSPKHLSKLPDDCTIIGQMNCGNGIKIYQNNQLYEYNQKGFVHFGKVQA